MGYLTTTAPSVKIRGVDLSHWNNFFFDVRQAKQAGVEFCYLKATEANSYDDLAFSPRVEQCQRNSMPSGAYHFARPSVSSGRVQAEYFIKYASSCFHDNNLKPALDLEDTGGLSEASLTNWVGDFLRRLRKEVDTDPVIYTNFNLSDNFGTLLWSPRYSNADMSPNVASPWKTYTIWQFSDGQVGTPNSAPGIGHVDLDTLNDGVTLADLLIKENKLASYSKQELTQIVQDALQTLEVANWSPHDGTDKKKPLPLTQQVNQSRGYSEDTYQLLAGEIVTRLTALEAAVKALQPK